MTIFIIAIGGFFLFSVVIMILGVSFLICLAYKSNNPYIEGSYKKFRNITYHSLPTQSKSEHDSKPIQNSILPCSDMKDEDSVPKSESAELELLKPITNEFTPITVGDDELIAPPMAKSNLEWEDTPADDSDIISDEGQLAMLNKMAYEAELRLERRMESY